MKLLTIALALSLNAFSAHADDGKIDYSYDSGKATQGLDDLDKATEKKWSQLEDWQTKSSWIDEQVRLGVVGIVYEKGMFGATVSRNIVPDKDSGWLAVDTISLPAGPLLTIGNLAGNIFFQEVFPFVQAQVIYDRSYVSVRHKDNYKDALLANPFKFKHIPATTDGFKDFENGELVSTLTTGGVYVRAGADLLKLMGVGVAGLNIGPAAKVQVYKQFKLTMAKADESNINVLIENTVDKGAGLGLTMGVSFDDVINAPISIGINQGDGYSPLRINYKYSQDKIDGIIYRINTDSADGKKAYASLLSRDLTTLDDLADSNGKDVIRELVRHGTIDTSEFNFGLDLFLYRSGFRNIFVKSSFNSTIASGKKFAYKEVSDEKINETESWFGGEQKDEKYSALIPLGDPSMDSFLVDTSFQYSDTKTSGKELTHIITDLRSTANDLPLRVDIDQSLNYGQVRAYLTVRFPLEAIRKVMTSSDEQIWAALGVSAGLPDPSLWITSQGRQSTKDEYKKLLENAKRTRKAIEMVKTKPSNLDKAEALIKFLNSDNKNKMLHRTLIELAGRDELLIHGGLHGLYIPKPLKPKK